MSRDDERGAALVVTLLVLLMLSAGALSVFALASSESSGTAVSRDFESALHVAESAGDRVILELVQDDDYVTCQPCAPTRVAHAYNPAVPFDPDSERAWAVGLFEAAVASGSPLLVQSGNGVGLGIRPVDGTGTAMDVVFAVGRVTGGHGDRTRVLRLSVGSGLYTPEHALLTQNPLTLNGSSGAVIDGSAGNVHANGDVTVNGSPSVSGTVSATGAISASGAQYVPGQPSVLVPPVSARRVYELRGDYSQYDPGGTYTGTWFDLCADGHVRPPAPPGGEPCTHPTSLNGGTATFRDWSYRSNGSGTSWTLSTNDFWSGAYYVVEAVANVSKTPLGTSLTVIAQAPAGTANEGSIQLSGTAKFTPHVQGLALLADRDVQINGTGAPGSLDATGLVLAGEQLEILGNGTVKGALVAADQSSVSSVVTGNSRFGGSGSVTYDSALNVPLPGMVQIIQWNEL